MSRPITGVGRRFEPKLRMVGVARGQACGRGGEGAGRGTTQPGGERARWEGIAQFPAPGQTPGEGRPDEHCREEGHSKQPGAARRGGARGGEW